MSSKLLAAAIVLASCGTVPALADGDPVEGAKIFKKKCSSCHFIDRDRRKVGPHLVGILGRSVASVEDYNYSDAMEAFGADGRVWDEETLTIYLRKPKATVKKTTMVFPGFKKDEDIEDLLAYLSDPSAVE